MLRARMVCRHRGRRMWAQGVSRRLVGLREQRTGSSFGRRSAGSSRQEGGAFGPSGLEARLERQGQMAGFFEKCQAQAATAIREEVAKHREVCAIQVVANTLSRVVVVERDVDDIRQNRDDVAKIDEQLQRALHRHMAEMQAQARAREEMHRQLEALQKEVVLSIAQASPPASLAPGATENYSREADPANVQIAVATPVDLTTLSGRRSPLRMSRCCRLGRYPRVAHCRGGGALRRDALPACSHSGAFWQEMGASSRSRLPRGTRRRSAWTQTRAVVMSWRKGGCAVYSRPFRASAADGMAFANYCQLTIVPQYVPLAKVHS